MSFGAFIALIPSLFKFWDQITVLIKTLEKTPEQKHEELMKKIQTEGDAYAAGARPDWN